MNLLKEYAKNLVNSRLKDVPAALIGKSYNDSRYYGGGLPFFTPESERGIRFLSNANALSLYDFQEIETAYFSCASLQAIILDKAQFANNGIASIVDINTDKPARGQFARDVLKAMEKPNVFQTYDMFRAESKVYVSLFGYHLVWYKKNVLNSFVNIWNLNPMRVKITFKGVYLNQSKLTDIIEKIEYYTQGTYLTVPIDEVVFVKDTNITRTEELGDKPPMLPTSRLIGMSFDIKNNIGAMQSRYSNIVSRGADGIIHNKSKDSAGYIPMLPEDKLELQNAYAMDFGTLPGQSKVIFSKSDLGFIPMRLNTKDLMLFEETDATKLAIAHNLGWPADLIPFSSKSTFENQNRAEIRAYQNTIIPEDTSEIPQLWAGWKLEEQGLKVIVDYSHVECLQEQFRATEKVKEENNRARILNLIAINNMRVGYETKINIAVSTLGITEVEAKQVISDEPTNTGANQGN